MIISPKDDVLAYFMNVSRVSTPVREDTVVPCVPESKYHFLNWDYISELTLTDDEYFRYRAHLNWFKVSKHISPELAMKYKEHVNWDIFLSEHQLSQKYINSIVDDDDIFFDWDVLFESQNLSSEFIDEHMHNILSGSQFTVNRRVEIMCRSQKLSEAFMHRFRVYLNWECIVAHQKISLEFVKEHLKYIDLNELEMFGDFSATEIAMLEN